MVARKGGVKHNEGRTGSPVTQNDTLAIESELEPIFDAVRYGLW